MQYGHAVHAAEPPTESRWGSLPLALRVGVFLAVAALVLPIVGAWLASRASRHAVEAQVYDGQEVAAAGVLDRLSAAYDAALEATAVVADRPNVTRALSERDGALAVPILTAVRGLGFFSALALYDDTGRRVAAVPADDAPDASTEPPARPRMDPPSVEGGTAFVTARVPVRDTVGVVGELVAKIPFEELTGGKAALLVAPNVGVAIVDRDGLILASPLDGTVGNRVSAAEAMALVRGGRVSTDRYYVPFTGYTVLATFVPADGHPWGALTSSRRDDALADSTSLGRQMVIGGGVMSVLALVLAALMSTYVGAAERRLRRARSQLASQNVELVAANADLEAYANAAAHDLRSPLVTIRGIAELTPRLEGDAFSERSRANMRSIEEQADRMFALIDAMLRYARAGTSGLSKTQVDLGELAASVVEGLEGLMQLGHGSVTIGDLPAVEGDVVLLAQVFQNLIANALMYAGPEGPVVAVDGESTDGVVRVFVRDNGPGIDPAEREQIFDMFVRGRASADVDGAGIGLAISRRIAERHGGTLDVVDDASVRGATFVLTLPARRDPA